MKIRIMPHPEGCFTPERLAEYRNRLERPYANLLEISQLRYRTGLQVMEKENTCPDPGLLHPKKTPR
jgi:hypothetical protein